MSSTWLAMAFVGIGFALVATGLLTRFVVRDNDLADILDLPWGEKDVDLADVVERRSQLVEGSVRAAGAVVASIDPRGALKAKLSRARVPLRPGEFVIVVGAGGLLGTLVLGAAASNEVLGLIALPLSVVAGNFVLSRRIAKRRRRFEEQFPEALTLIASSLTAGHTFLRAIQMMSEEAGGPIAEEFGRVVSETELGDPLVDSLQRMAERLDMRDVDWVVQAIRIQQTVGGKLADLLHTLADFIRAREEVRREVDVLTAEGRVSAYVLGGMPLFLLLFISVTNPTYMSPMYRGWGFVWLAGAAAVTIGSIAVILRMVKSVEV